MSNAKKCNIFKMLLIVAGTIGISALGISIYKKTKLNKDKQIDLDLFYKELNEILTSDCNYTYKLLKEEASGIIDGTFENVFDLESLKIAQDMYYKSKGFMFKETRALAKDLYVYDIKIIESYLGRISDDEIKRSSKKLSKSIEQVLSISQINNIDDLYNDIYLEETVFDTHKIIKENLSKNCPFTKHLLKYNTFLEP